MVVGYANFSNPSSTARICSPRTVLRCAQGALFAGDKLYARTGGGAWSWVDWITNQDENGDPQVWGDGSFREVAVWLRAVTLDADSRTEFEFDVDNTGATPTFALESNVAASLGSFLTTRTSSGGFDLQLDIDPGSARSDPKSILTDGALVQLVDGQNVKVFRWQVRSGDARHIWTTYLEVYSGLPFAMFDAMESFSTPSTTDWTDNMTVGWRVHGEDCWPIIHQETLRMDNPGAGTFAAWDRDYGGTGNVLQGQGCGFRSELWFLNPTGSGGWTTEQSNTYTAIGEHPRVWGVAKEWRTTNSYGPRGRVPGPPPQFTNFASMQAAERTRAKAAAQQGTADANNLGAFYHDVYGGNVQTRATASDTVHGHARAIEVVMSDEPTFLERIANAVTQDNCRPGWLYEDGSYAGTRDGDLVSNLVRFGILLWDGLPFVYGSMDPWGKTAQPNRDLARTGWTGTANRPWQFWDRQHYISHNCVALAALSGDWIAKHQVAHHREHLRSVQPDNGFRQYSVFATEFEASREVGRCLRSAAWIQKHFPEDQFRQQIQRRVRGVLGEVGLRLRTTFNSQFPGFTTLWDFSSQTIPHELTALEHDMTTLNAVGWPPSPEATGILYWQDGLMADGLFSWFGVDPAASRAFDLGLQTAENCTLYGFFEDTQTTDGRGQAAGGYYNVYQALRMSGDANRPDASLLPPAVNYSAADGGRGPHFNSTLAGREYVEFRVYHETPRWAIPAAIYAYDFSPILAIRRQAAKILKGYFQTYVSLPASDTWHAYGDTDMAWVPCAAHDPWTEDYDALIGTNPGGGGGPVVHPGEYDPNPDPYNPGGTTTGVSVGLNELDPDPDPTIASGYPDPGLQNETDPNPDVGIVTGGTSTGVGPNEVDPVLDPVITGGGSGGPGGTSEVAPDTEPTGSTGGGGGGGSGPGYPQIGEFMPEPNASGSGGGNPGSQPAGICSIAFYGELTATHEFTFYVSSVGCFDIGVTVLGPDGYTETASLIGRNTWKLNLLGRAPGLYYATADCNDTGEVCSPRYLSFAYDPPMTAATSLWAAVRATYPSDGLLQLTNPNNRCATAILDSVGEQACQRVIDLFPVYAQTTYDSTNAYHVEVGKVGTIAMLYEQGNTSTQIAKVKFEDVFSDTGMLAKIKRVGPRGRPSAKASIEYNTDGSRRRPWANRTSLPDGILPNDYSDT